MPAKPADTRLFALYLHEEDQTPSPDSWSSVWTVEASEAGLSVEWPGESYMFHFIQFYFFSNLLFLKIENIFSVLNLLFGSLPLDVVAHL